MSVFLRFFAVFALLLSLAAAPAFSAVKSLDDDDDYLFESAGQVVPDPLEPLNRAVFKFNDVVLEHVARPAYKGYAAVTPEPVRTGIKNFFHNLSFPVRFVNNLLQGKGKAAGVEMSRFILNTTAGLGGIFDVAKDKKPIVPVEDEDFGQTLGVWGAGEGMYIVWPLIGPSTVRDSAGRVGDYFLEPLTYVQPWEVALGANALKTFNSLDDVLDLYDELKKTSVEPYSSVRDAYVQYRRAKIAK